MARQSTMFLRLYEGDKLKERIPLVDFAITAATLAEAGGVTPGYIRELCRAGRLKALKVGTTWLIAEDSADAWLETRRGRGRPANGEETPSWAE